MKITVVGAGYAGLCTAVGFAVRGHDVVCVDINQERVDKVNNGVPPIFEHNLDVMLKDALKAGRIRASTKLSSDSDLYFIAVQTPTKEKQDLSFVMAAAKDISNVLGNGYKVVAMKSTVIPGTTESIIPVLEQSGL